MNESQFSFLEAEFSAEFELASRAERRALSDPGSAAIYARKCLESGVEWAYRHDRGLPQPYVDTLDAYLNEPAFKELADGRIFNVAKKIERAGNRGGKRVEVVVEAGSGRDRLSAVPILLLVGVHVWPLGEARPFGEV